MNYTENDLIEAIRIRTVSLIEYLMRLKVKTCPSLLDFEVGNN